MNFLTYKKIRYLFGAYCFILIVEFFYRFILSIVPRHFRGSFLDFTTSDWLINYEAGFVRRGLWGQIFFYLYDWWGINAGYLIYFLSYLFLFIFLYLFIREWRRNNLSLFLLPSVCLVGAFAMSYLLWFRRDVLIFLLIWCILKGYHSFLSGNKKALWIMYFFSGVTILSHEASFFYFVPLLGLHFFLMRLQKEQWKIALGKAFLFLLPIGAVMLLCVIYKGNGDMAYGIWHSWDGYFISNFGEILPMGKGCEALGWDGMETFKNHFSENYLNKTLGIYRFCIWPFIFVAVYYLLIQVNKIKLGIREEKRDDASLGLHLSLILVLQFVFLLPMFTVLSCDLRRVVLYWTLSSFLFYFRLGENWLQAFEQGKFAVRISKWNRILSTGKLGNKYVYIVVAVFLGIPFYGFSELNAFSSSVLGNIAFVFFKIYSLLSL